MCQRSEPQEDTQRKDGHKQLQPLARRPFFLQWILTLQARHETIFVESVTFAFALQRLPPQDPFGLSNFRQADRAGAQNCE
jgi:hypothetical protein